MTFNGQYQVPKNDEELRRIRLQIYGSFENTQKAYNRCLILLDELVSRHKFLLNSANLPKAGMHVDRLDVDPRLHMIMAGNGKKDITRVMHDTMTNIYLPSPFIRTKSSDPDPRPIFVTGKKVNVADAIEKLRMLCHQKVGHFDDFRSTNIISNNSFSLKT